jgi:hypothetical protein
MFGKILGVGHGRLKRLVGQKLTLTRSKTMNGKMDGVCAARQTQVDEQLSRLDNQLDRVDHLESALRERLGGVLRAEPMAKGEGQPEETLVPLADRVRSIMNTISRIADGFEHTLNCIEV